MPTPVQTDLYAEVKAIADKKFLAQTSAYKSAWIVAEYKRRGGIYREDGKKKGLVQWFREKWVDLERPKKDMTGKVVGYEACGRKEASRQGTYPLCRPSRRVHQSTPLTVAEVTVANKDKDRRIKPLAQVKQEKQKVKEKGNISFAKSNMRTNVRK